MKSAIHNPDNSVHSYIEEHPSVLLSLQDEITRAWLTGQNYSIQKVSNINPPNLTQLRMCYFHLVRFRKPADIKQGLMAFLDTVALLQQPFLYAVVCHSEEYHVIFGLSGEQEDQLGEHFDTMKNSIRGLFPGCEINGLDSNPNSDAEHLKDSLASKEDFGRILGRLRYRMAITGLPAEKAPDSSRNVDQTEMGLELLADAVTDDFILMVRAIPLSTYDRQNSLSQVSYLHNIVHQHSKISAQHSQTLSQGESTSTSQGYSFQQSRSEGLSHGISSTRESNIFSRLSQNISTFTFGGQLNQQQANEQKTEQNSNSVSITSNDTTTTNSSTGSTDSLTLEHTSKEAVYIEDLLNRMHKRLSSGGALWSCFTEVCSTSRANAERIAQLLCGRLSGEESRLEPMRFVPLPESVGPHNFNELSTGHTHPFGNAFSGLASVLTTPELACLTRLPLHDLPGIEVEKLADYGRNWIKPDSTSLYINLGNLIDRENYSDNREITITTSQLQRHCFVSGATGSGKSNTMRSIVSQLWQKCNIPFLVIEPVKREYRQIKRTFGSMRVFSLGDHSSRFSLNPFDFYPKIGLIPHIDLLKSAFQASLGMYSSMPYILEHIIYEAYRRHGWDLATGQNTELEETAARLGIPAYGPLRVRFLPRLSELIDMVDDAIVHFFPANSDYSVSLTGALKSRLNSLCQGSKGQLLDCRLSMPMEILLNRPCVLELWPFTDNEEKSFVMALLLMRLYEYRQVEEIQNGAMECDQLKHLLVFEEAHRLLAKPMGSGEHSAQGRQKGVEVFADILAEIRSYGQGLVIVDQIPSKLIPDVLRNTDLKIAHRLVDKEDRQILGATMNLDEDQMHDLARFSAGYACIYYSGLRKSLHVKIKKSPLPSSEGRLTNFVERTTAFDRIESEVFGSPCRDVETLPDLDVCLNWLLRMLCFVSLASRSTVLGSHTLLLKDLKTTLPSFNFSAAQSGVFRALNRLPEELGRYDMPYPLALGITVDAAIMLRAWFLEPSRKTNERFLEGYDGIRKILWSPFDKLHFFPGSLLHLAWAVREEKSVDSISPITLPHPNSPEFAQRCLNLFQTCLFHSDFPPERAFHYGQDLLKTAKKFNVLKAVLPLFQSVTANTRG